MDQCTHCTSRGDYALCKATPCGKHEDWIVQDLTDQLSTLTADLAIATDALARTEAEVLKLAAADEVLRQALERIVAMYPANTRRLAREALKEEI